MKLRLGHIERVHLVGAGLTVALVPLVVLPVLRDREERPDRPGENASCPVDPPGSSPFEPGPEIDPGLRAPTLGQAGSADGGQPVFRLDLDGDVVVVRPDVATTVPATTAPAGVVPGIGGTGGTGGTGGSTTGADPGTGGTDGTTGGGGGTTGAGEGTGGTDGTSPAGTAVEGPDDGRGEDGDPTATTSPDTTAPTSTIAPDEVAEEVLEDDAAKDGFDLSVLFPLLVVVLLAAAAVLLARRRTTAGDREEHADESALEQALRDAGLDDLDPEEALDAEVRLRLAFVRGLYALDDADLVPFDPARTSGAVARRLRRPRRRPFLDASGTFDQVVYGGRPARDEDVDRVETGFDQVLGAEEPKR